MARSITRPVGFSSSSSTTTTLTTVEDFSPSSSSSSSQQRQQQTLVLRLSRIPSTKKKVSWKEGTVDNEFLNRKSSKKCCVFHKQKPFDEDDSDDDDGSDGRDRSMKDVGDGGGTSGCCSHGGH
eukprot:TRINITY_DN1610_c1_g1_i2.p3 TRINITY_DN1610_c1_g1~~TRINITY_DN1610_c1_g1_i2.p3  ORF type:complete len:135 (-),score=24.11 TRINITY_DN1610_c1_g1_i2:277-648(-)